MAYSPDLNPKEHVWDMFCRRIADRQPSATCLPDLRRAFLDEWCNSPQDEIDNLILSMPRHYDERSGRPNTATTDESITKVPQRVLDDY
ncbi:transposable element Tc3 transposase [Trichonephila clavipes]|nr:transposable element Tc3 transposase [Trichonephila clavipes]